MGNLLNNPVRITLSPEELSHVRFLKRPAYNSIIVGIGGKNFRAAVKEVVNVARLTELHHTYQGKVNGVMVISSDKIVWVVPHQPTTVVAKL